MNPSVGQTLQAARDAKGWSVEQLASRTRIAAEHIRAIEADEPDSLPGGPWRAAWTQTLCDELEIDAPIEAVTLATPRTPLWVVRVIGGLASITLVGLIAFQWFGPEAQIGEPLELERVKDQIVEITARDSAKVKVSVDGEEAFSGRIPGGETRRFEAYGRIRVDVRAVDQVRIRYNGQRVVPQGRQDAPRTLMFVDDEGGR